MRLFLLFLTFACGSALADELFRYAPAGTLSEDQRSIFHWKSQQGFKSVTAIEINKAALNSNVITLTVKGKTYRLEGKLTQGPPFPTVDMSGKVLRMNGQVIWSGQSSEGFGGANYSDMGNLTGEFTLGGMKYVVASSGDNMNGFLVEIEPESAWPDPLFHVPHMAPILTANQEKVRDRWAKQPGTISVTTVQVDKPALKSDVVTLTIKGKRYRFDGKWRRTEPQQIDEGWRFSVWMTYPIIVPSSSTRPGMTSWDGQGRYGSGSFHFHDGGEVSGNVTITGEEGRGHYRLESAGDLAFLIEHEEIHQRKVAPEEDPTARKARLEAEVAQRAADEKALRTYKGDNLFAPANEASLQPQYKYQLEFMPPDRSALGLYPIRVNRLAIDAPVTILTIDGKQYRFAGKASITRTPRSEKPVRETAYSGGVSESWEGHTSSGDRAKITRTWWGMSGELYVDGRHLVFDTHGEFGLLTDLDPKLMAERGAQEMRGRRQAVQEATSKWRPPPMPFVPVETVASAQSPPAPASPNAEPCAMKTRLLSDLDTAEGFPQPAHLRTEMAELRAIVKAEVVELQC